MCSGAPVMVTSRYDNRIFANHLYSTERADYAPADTPAPISDRTEVRFLSRVNSAILVSPRYLLYYTGLSISFLVLVLGSQFRTMYRGLRFAPFSFPSRRWYCFRDRIRFRSPIMYDPFHFLSCFRIRDVIPLLYCMFLIRPLFDPAFVPTRFM
jgi:hypothetical protein